MDTEQTSTEQICVSTDQNGNKYAQHHIRGALGIFVLSDSGGNVSDLALARNCSLARMLPGEAELVSE